VASPVLEQEAIVITAVQADKSSSQQSDKLESQEVASCTQIILSDDDHRFKIPIKGNHIFKNIKT
jgi:hypothetical protein